MTEVRWLPADWSMRPLGSCLLKAPSYGINAPAVAFDDRLPSYVRITDISDDHRFSPAPRVSVAHRAAADFFLREGDVVIARTGASVGKSYRYEPADGKLVFAGFLIRFSPDPSQLNSAFLAYCLQTKRYWDWVSMMSARSGQPGINAQEYGTFPVPLPQPSEQCAIAEALSDVDGLLGALDALIAKKRAIKQAAMQQLLTGKTRLPGFDGDWVSTRLGDLISLIPAGIYGSDKAAGAVIGMRVATTAHIDATDTWNERSMETRYFTEEQCERYSPREGDLIVVKSSGSAASIQSGKVAFVDRRRAGSFIFSNFLLLLRPEGCNSKFLYFQLTSARVKRLLPQLVEASTYPNLRLNDYLELSIPCPSVEEQVAIATVLADMDYEITALEARRDKTRAIKQGIMQQLLTGRVRLLKSEQANEEADA